MRQPSAPSTFSDVDALVAQGQLPAAAELLDQLLGAGQPTAAQWLQLAGLRRAIRQPRKALDAVHRALALEPLDFMALVMRAGLLERLDDPAAGEAWAEALAQRPEGDLPSPLAAAVAAGAAFHAAWQADREAQLIAATAPAEKCADADAAWRIARFRDNVLRKTKVYHSEPTHFHFPGLTEREYFPRHMFSWLAEVEAATSAIREELLAVMQSDRSELVPYLEYSEHEALAQWRALNRNPDWTAIHLIKRGQIVSRNADQCPRTMALLSHMPQPTIAGASANAMFSLLAPHKVIPPHVGVNNARLLCHLPLIVPEGCWFRVGAETRLWREGEAFVFDDTFEHEAANPTDQLRVVMIFDIWHPDLTEAERQAVAALIAADGNVGNIS
ncbi:MAG: hypothetical protein RLZZ136_141 [Pseudomonadota bacterium]|jgi:aspartyl/asparaginyl beta-hydroxylase (cupin superfamily)